MNLSVLNTLKQPPANQLLCLRLMLFLSPEKNKAHFETVQATGKTADLYKRFVSFFSDSWPCTDDSLCERQQTGAYTECKFTVF